MKKLILLTAVLLTLGMNLQANAVTITNGGFETGDLTGWISNGNAEVVTSSLASSGATYTPVEGNYMAELDAGLGANVYTTLSQDISMSAGDSISGSAAFLAKDYIQYNTDGTIQYSGNQAEWNDDAYVEVLNGNNLMATPWSDNVLTVGSYGDSGWQNWNFTATNSGVYTLQFGVENAIDNILPSSALFDNVTGSSPIPAPEPTSILLGLMSLGGVFGFKRNK